MGFRRVVTHNDFDGVVCAAICSHIYGMENIFFISPRDVQNARFPIDKGDIVCDLPYPLDCGMWFDHHPGNLEDVRLRGIDPDAIPGRFRPDPSAARTVYDYFAEEWEMAPYLAGTVAEADVIDSFAYSSIDEWRRPTPGKNVDRSMKAPFGDHRERLRYLHRVALWVRDYPLEQIERFPEVVEARLRYEGEEERSLKLIRESASFLPQDPGGEVAIVDLTGYRTRPHLVRQVAFLEYPQALAALVVSNPMLDGRKSTNLSVGMSLSVLLSGREHGKDVGEIMRTLNIGDGHAGAGAGTIECRGKEDMLRAKEQLLAEILALWRQQPLEREGDAPEERSE